MSKGKAGKRTHLFRVTVEYDYLGARLRHGFWITGATSLVDSAHRKTLELLNRDPDKVWAGGSIVAVEWSGIIDA